MLIFVKGWMLALIASGRKTTTIRPWRQCKLRPGVVLSFNGKVRVLLTSVEHRRVDSLTEADWRADGFDTRDAFDAALGVYYPALQPSELVWVLHFVTVPITLAPSHD